MAGKVFNLAVWRYFLLAYYCDDNQISKFSSLPLTSGSPLRFLHDVFYYLHVPVLSVMIMFFPCRGGYRKATFSDLFVAQLVLL